MTKNTDDELAQTLDADAKLFERELTAVVRRVLDEELRSETFRQRLADALSAATVPSAAPARKSRKGAPSLGSSPAVPASQDFEPTEPWVPELVEESARYGPSASSESGQPGGRRQPGGDGPPVEKPEGSSGKPWIPWVFAGILGVGLFGAGWLARDHQRDERTRGRAGEPRTVERSTDGRAREVVPSSDPDPTPPRDPRATWLRAIERAQGLLPATSPLRKPTADDLYDCFFPPATRERLELRGRDLGGDLGDDFSACVLDRHPLVPKTPNAAVFATQGLVIDLLTSLDDRREPWCPNPDLQGVNLVTLKADGVAGGQTYRLLRGFLLCAHETGGLAFDDTSPPEAYLAAAWLALGELERMRGER